MRIPDSVSFEDAAAASMTLLTSWHMLVGRARIRPGQVVLIMGGGSGVGNYGIQIAKLYGCTVIATASPDKLGQLLELGADYAVDHRKDDWHREVRSIAREIPRPYGDVPSVDVIFEHIGGTHWNKELTLLGYGGTIVTTGATTGYDADTDLRHIFFKGINILGSTQGTRAELEQGLYWMSQGRIHSIIDSVYTFEDAAEAHTRMLILSGTEAEETGNDKTSIIFSIRHEPGSLFRIIERFHRDGVNLTKIESRPAKTDSWEYNFYVDFEGHRRNPVISEMLGGIGQDALFLKVLGSYPCAKV